MINSGGPPQLGLRGYQEKLRAIHSFGLLLRLGMRFARTTLSRKASKKLLSMKKMDYPPTRPDSWGKADGQASLAAHMILPIRWKG